MRSLRSKAHGPGLVGSTIAVAIAISVSASVASANAVIRTSSTFKTPVRSSLVQHVGGVNTGQIHPFTIVLRGQSADDAHAVATYLRAYGLTVVASPNNHFLHVVGTLGQIGSAAHTGFERVKFGGETFVRTTSSANFPQAIAVRIRATSINPGMKMKSLAIRPQASVVGPQTGYGPQTLATVYNINSAYASGINGAGQAVDIAACFNIDPNDIAFFESFYGLPPNVVHVIHVDGTTDQFGQVPPPDLEPTLDVERVIGTAPNARVNLYLVPDCFVSQFVDMFAQIAENGHADALSVSYGLDESDYAQAGAGDLIIAQNAALEAVRDAHITTFAASGDNGSWGDPFIAVNFLDVLYPASDPNVIAVGGTTLETSTIGTRLFEYAWGGSGGGVSGIFPIPPWQAATRGVASGLFKNLPDVSMDADPNTGVATAFLVSFPPPIFPVGGTSASSPAWAGVMALVNQARAMHGHHMPLQNVAARLYTLRRNPNVFGDIRVGANGYFAAKRGYDNATGIGVPNVGNLVRALQ